MHSTLLTRFLLIFALLVAQLGGLAHGISHALAEQEKNSKQSLLHDKYCDLCEAYAQIGSAISSSSLSFTSSENHGTLHVGYSSSYLSSRFVAFAARGPPNPA